MTQTSHKKMLKTLSQSPHGNDIHPIMESSQLSRSNARDLMQQDVGYDDKDGAIYQRAGVGVLVSSLCSDKQETNQSSVRHQDLQTRTHGNVHRSSAVVGLKRTHKD